MLLPPSPASTNQGLTSADSCSALVRAFISSRLDYCNSLLTGIDKSQVNKLQSILRVAARLVMRKGKFEPISNDIRDKLHWLPIQQRIKFKIGVLVYRCLHGTAPPYLSEMINAAADTAGRRSLRSAAHGDLVVPRSRTVGFGSRMFAVSGPTFWNSFTSTLFGATKFIKPLVPAPVSEKLWFWNSWILLGLAQLGLNLKV